ncbi:MAG: sigma-54-dependent Fis family transcriptional regulator [Rhodocyclaceae bacterium]|jgi:DNA-binding NtrC family response regulator|uniref:Fis family transcriptional regulator n=1 Tax=Fluviibacter phosphoraccumulans TaxID=1751046 RepID=A0A679HVL4_9RHOO|nr:response regulator [Fluviibacter phosphoraccumulans]MBP7991569.1 sigma-54-dependent Fis family transcriptional regulator [Rhodocyclaceae bacterium]BBU68223.1 Fis family transcriptional regulator [Fluviibacter phosphoraccumulans]BBU70238.1 Fis family transcriptional regulator [Fluviibacter phosphoraccumulans]BCA66406.1 Fis family transcriptional regulator [Fluviibacter phosphoraccumulans]
MAEILVVDDEVGIRELLSEILADEGHSVMLAENATKARELRSSRRPDLVLLDIWMPDADGISLLKEWSANGLLTMPVVMMSGHGTIDTAVEATRIGAVDFLEKPIALQKLLATVKKCLKPDASATRQHYAVDSLLQIGLLKKFGQRIAQSAKHSPILFLRGAQGLIAEVGARSLLTPHAPWLNLSQESRAITQEMLEQHAGGVLFLPELHGAGRMAQMNLSFVLDRLAKYRMTLVVASSVSAEAIIESGVDAALVNRLSDVWVGLPAIAESANDLPELLPALLTLLCEQGNVPHRNMAPDALNVLRQKNWSGADGGWSSLLGALKNLALNALDETISRQDVDALLLSVSEPVLQKPVEESDGSLMQFYEMPLKEARDAFERLYLTHHISRSSGNMTRVAEQSGLERTHLYRKFKQLGITLERRDNVSGV